METEIAGIKTEISGMKTEIAGIKENMASKVEIDDLAAMVSRGFEEI
jgi:hypothetical protein